MQGNELYSKCNMCGKKENFSMSESFHSFTGYAGNRYKDHGEYITLYFCPECLDKLVNGTEYTEVSE